jgi:hypothetical protein
LVGAELAVRIESNGQVTVFAGSDSRPLARAPLSAPAGSSADKSGAASQNVGDAVMNFAAVLAWIDKVGTSGLDGQDLRQIGLKNGNLTVDDQRTGKRWNFTGINIGMARPNLGGLIFRIGSESSEHPWDINAAFRPLGSGIRAVGIEARQVSIRDILLATRVEGIDADFLMSGSLRAEFLPDGTLQTARGQFLTSAGIIRNIGEDGDDIKIEMADARFAWDSNQKTLIAPFQIKLEGAQFTMLARIEADAEYQDIWKLSISRSDPVIDPIILTAGGEPKSESFALNNVTIKARIDLAQRRVIIDQGDFGRHDVRAEYNVGVAVTGSYDYSNPISRINFGVAGTRMSVPVLKRLWPKPVSPHIRRWVNNHISGGMVERILIAGSLSMTVMNESGVPIPDEALSVEVDTSGTTLRPVTDLPDIRDADLSIRATGRTAYVGLGRGTIEIGPGRRLNIAEGKFEVPDTHLKNAPCKTTFRLDGTVPAAAALLATERLRRTAGLALDPASSRGTMSARIGLDLTLSQNDDETTVRYAAMIDLTNFVAEQFLLGQKIEAPALHVSADSDGYVVKGDVKLNGTPASLDFRKAAGVPEGDLRLQASLDEAARRRMGIQFGRSVAGSIPIKVTGRINPDAAGGRLSVSADLTPVKINNLLPGWNKAAGRSSRATFMLIKDGKHTKFEDLNIEGQGVVVKGSVEIDGNGDLVAANFPVFGLSDGDRASLQAERAADGVLRVALRGDIYDARAFVKSAAGGDPDKNRKKSTDIDVDIKIGAVAGHNGEALRALELKFNRRGGQLRSFWLKAKVGRDAPLNGDLRLRSQDKQQVVYLETDDAGALLRFTDAYPRLFGGQMWLAIDPPSDDTAAQVGVLSIRNFEIRGEKDLARVVSGAPGSNRNAIEFSELRANFVRQSGLMRIRDGIVRGPLIGATIDGQVDFSANDMRLRGTFVPLYAINNIFGQIPIVGIFLGGGSNEGLLGITYEASGPLSAPRIAVNPISAVAPGLLRKMLPTPGMFDPAYVQPSR